MSSSITKRPTIREVAALAGVSRGTVSRVLNGGRWVSEEAEAAVRDAIVSTGYKPNPHARSLATNKSNSVAFLLTETSDTLFDDPVFSILVRGTAQALARHGQSLVVLIAGTPAEQTRAADYITGGHVDGVLLAYSSHGDNPLVRELLAAGVPIVAFGSPFGASGSLGSIASDDYNGARQMVDHLRQRGRTRIAFIAGPDGTPGGVGRLGGYRDALGDSYDANLVDRGDWTPRSGAEAMSRLLERASGLDAVFAANDQMAAGALGVLHAAGFSVPQDVAVGGFDDSNVASTTTPSLTTMRQPFARISTEGVALLLDLIAGHSPTSITLPVDLVVRQST
jgi:DNA-binding LacI/PurR family transcriptional regulator